MLLRASANIMYPILKMEYKRPAQSSPTLKPRLIIHGGAGNIKPTNLTPERYKAIRESLLRMVCR